MKVSQQQSDMNVSQVRKTVVILRRESRRANNLIFATRGVEEAHLPVGMRSLENRIKFDRVLNEAISKRKEYESALKE